MPDQESDAAQQRRARVRVAVEAALAAGLFYDSDVQRFVSERCLSEDDAVQAFLGNHNLPSDKTEAYAVRLAVQERVASAPRGTWASFRQVGRDRVWYWASISDGSGKVALGGSHDTYDAQPAYENVFRRMREMETYQIRSEIREEGAHAAQMEALATFRFAVGQTFTNVDLGQSGRANRIELTSVDQKTGAIGFNLIKRGSRKRYTGTTTAVALVENAKLTKPAPAAATPSPATPQLFDVA